MATAKAKPERNERVRPALRAALRVQAAFPDSWALLNATPEEIERVAEGYPAEEVSDLETLLEALHYLYFFTAAGMAERLGQGPVWLEEEDAATGARSERWETEEEKQQTEERWDKAFDEGAETVMRLLGKYGLLPQLCLQRGKDGAELDLKWGEPRGTLFPVLQSRISTLFADLLDARPVTVFVCENCGKIGPAERTRKRFCDAACRTAAYRKRRDSA